jgi:hypothetical protein
VISAPKNSASKLNMKPIHGGQLDYYATDIFVNLVDIV